MSISPGSIAYPDLIFPPLWTLPSTPLPRSKNPSRKATVCYNGWKNHNMGMGVDGRWLMFSGIINTSSRYTKVLARPHWHCYSWGKGGRLLLFEHEVSTENCPGELSPHSSRLDHSVGHCRCSSFWFLHREEPVNCSDIKKWWYANWMWEQLTVAIFKVCENVSFLKQ